MTTSADHFVEAISRFKSQGGGARNFDEVAKAFFASDRVKRIVSHQAHQHGLTSEQDQLKQEIILVLLYRVLPILDQPENVYHALVEVTRRTCLGLKRKTMGYNEGRYTSLDTTSAAEDSDEPGFEKIFHRDDGTMANADDGAIAGVERNIAREALFKDFRQRIQNDSRLGYLAEKAIKGQVPEMPLRDSAAMPSANAATESQPTAPPRTLPPDAARLSEIRAQLGLSIADFAGQLSVERGRLTSYLYGRTKTVPTDLMEAAEAYLAERGNLRQKANDDFGNRPMSAITREWGTSLKLASDQLAGGIAAILQVSPVTVRRWLNDRTRPGLKELEDYHELIRCAASKAAEIA